MRDMAGGREVVKGGQMLVLNTMVRIGLNEKVGSEPRIAVSEGTATHRSGGSRPVPGQEGTCSSSEEPHGQGSGARRWGLSLT